MTLRQLEVFLAVSRDGSFSRAARTLGLSQPTLSEHVHELERELGRPLFVRRGRTIALTEAGRVFEPHAQRAVRTVADGRQAVMELDGLTRGALLIGAGTTPGIYVLPALLAEFRRRYPGIDVTLRIANSRVIEDQVRANQLDLGVVGGHGLAPGERCVAAGLVDELALIVAPRHPWARRREIAPERLGGQRVLIREPGSATREVMERALHGAGVTLPTTMELDHTEAIKQAVMAGLGVALVSVHAVRGELATRRLRVVRLRGLRIRRHFHVIHNDARALGASARAFTALLEAHARSAVRAT
ncbi:MAG: LysR family transcriptional regulator [Candidatus Rokubacteria bacterium]|nr:LysR family transcriptional regulator [Candidatus Rokubacteria bacterium]